MDYFGIGSALKAGAEIYFRAARRSGRTTSLLESLKSGDRVIFKTQEEAHRFKRLALAQGKEIETIAADVNDSGIDRIVNQRKARGRTIFDHNWVEARHLFSLENEMKLIDRMQKDFSGSHVSHVEDEIAYHDRKWMHF